MGQDLKADALLSSSKADVRLVLPSVCLMEAISAFDWKRIERNRLKDELDKQLLQLQRSINVQTAQQLATELAQADLTNTRLLSDLFQRLDDYVMRVADRAELIPISADVVRHEARIVHETELDRDDALILASILSHSENQPGAKKAFLTGDIKDFLKQPVRVLLNNAGIKLLSSTENALGWTLERTE
jgi:predicted nucleic acid-binding protein